jgi:hypothetical protein
MGRFYSLIRRKLREGMQELRAGKEKVQAGWMRAVVREGPGAQQSFTVSQFRGFTVSVIL